MSLPDIAVVIPAYKVSTHIKEVILQIPDNVRYVIVVDDKCPESSGREAERLQKKNVIVLYHERNEGVGAAVVTGYRKALEEGCAVAVKMDGDGQMDPNYIESLIEPLLNNEADYAKGNRFRDFHALKTMPRIRLFGNSILSFFVKVASGYWDIMDPTNGYTAIHRRVLEELNFGSLSKKFFFESDMLIHLNIVNAVVKDISMPAQYGEEKSSLKITRALLQFPPRLMRGLVKRIFLKYFIYDFNMASVYLLIGLPVFVLSIVYGIIQWVDSLITGMPRSAGTIMLVALPIIISFQMLLQAVQIDILAVPKKK
ncbi:MAG TPA: glycosyl transferase family 2 [Nitrospiraceae bacterium]|jgi:glycosyltransferase involved in cell wall biosynthesis|nr:glycosyl transferase family 2 [Nitrospiraceae bacterium]